MVETSGRWNEVRKSATKALKWLVDAPRKRHSVRNKSDT